MLKRLIRFEMLIALMIGVGLGSAVFITGRAMKRARD
jgi:hypothetical protein